MRKKKYRKRRSVNDKIADFFTANILINMVVIIGTVGALELNDISVGRALLRGAVSLLIIGLSLKSLKNGGYIEYVRAEDFRGR